MQAPTMIDRLSRLAYSLLPAEGRKRPTVTRPQWDAGKRVPYRRRFGRHTASCYELPPIAYGPFSPIDFD